MDESSLSRGRLRSALFVDFDNIYTRLQQEAPGAGEKFATNPARWLEWLLDPRVGRAPTPNSGTVDRRVIIRRCYLNPQAYGRYRGFFTIAAFEVIDCPPLTSEGKTSADIHMVLDIMDAIRQPTRIDEFMILSGDADFTPVLLRLRKHDRRALILPIGASSPAYRAASDRVLDVDDFIEFGLRFQPDALAAGPRPVSAGERSLLLRRMGQKVFETARERGGILARDLHLVYREFSEFTATDDWLGFGRLLHLTRAILETRDDLEIEEGELTWSVVVRPEPAAAQVESATEPLRPPLEADFAGSPCDRIEETVRQFLAASDRPLPMAAVAQHVLHSLGVWVLESRWAGAGSFGELVERWSDDGLAVQMTGPGYIYDPRRHRPPSAEAPRGERREPDDPELAGLIRRIRRLTDTPALTPEEYQRVFSLIAEVINADSYNIVSTSKEVRDRCIEEGMQVARASISFILRGICNVGHRFVRGEETGSGLAESFCANVLRLCERADLPLNPREAEMVRHWLLAPDASGEALDGEPLGESIEEPAGEPLAHAGRVPAA